MNPFEIVGQLSTSTKNNWEEIGDKGYNAFMTNRAFSYHYDTIMLANEMNKLHRLPSQLQYDFYRIAIKPKKKRFASWAKAEKDSVIDLVMSSYYCNRQRAIEMISLMSDKDIKFIKEVTDKGGR
jgi:Bacteriophage clamp loader A subunit